MAKQSATQTVNAMYSPSAKRSSYQYNGKPIYHASSRKEGTDRTSTCFFVIEDNGKRELIAIGQRKNSNSYIIDWAKYDFLIKEGKIYQL